MMTLPPSPDLQYKSTIELLREAGFLSIHQLVACTTIAMTLRIMKTGKPINLANKINSTGHSRTRSVSLMPPRVKLNLSLESFSNQAPRLYNAMPDHLKTSEPPNRLKQPVLLIL